MQLDSIPGRVFIYAASLATVAAFTAILLLAPVATANTAAPLLLLSVLVVARFWGTGPALAASSLAAVVYNYYFLPPAGLWIEDPNDWVAFVTFIVTAVIAGELSARAERRRSEAQAGRQEIERLYQELQAAFDRASEAEAARRNEQLKAALLDALTHNLRTPLTSIKAAVTALLGAGLWSEGRALSADGRHELLEVIDEESDRLNRFIEGLSTPGVPDSHPFSLRSVPLEDIVRGGLGRAETLTRDHHVIVDIQPGLTPLSVDAQSVAEVLYILLDNASKYAPAATTIRVTARAENDQHVRMCVADEGPGIPAELRERVFEKFFRIPQREPRDPRRMGIGLGLPIARRLIETQGGRLWIETPPSGVGTSFVMMLPVAANNPVSVPAAMSAGNQ